MWTPVKLKKLWQILHPICWMSKSCKRCDPELLRQIPHRCRPRPRWISAKPGSPDPESWKLQHRGEDFGMFFKCVFNLFFPHIFVVHSRVLPPPPPPPPPPPALPPTHNLSPHPHTHTQLTHTQLVHTQLAHTQLVNTQLTHTQLVHTQLTHTQLVHTQLAHTPGNYGTGLALVVRLGRQAWHLATSTSTLCGRRGTWRHRPALCVAGVALMALGWLWSLLSHTTLSCTTLSHISFTHNFVTHFFHTQLCHTHTTLSHTTLSNTTLSHTQLCHAQLFHTQLFHTQLCHIHSFTHNLLHPTLSHTIRSHTTLLHTQTHTHTHNTVTHSSCLAPSPFSFLPFPSRFHICLVIIGRSWHVGFSGPLMSFNYMFMNQLNIQPQQEFVLKSVFNLGILDW